MNEPDRLKIRALLRNLTERVQELDIAKKAKENAALRANQASTDLAKLLIDLDPDRQPKNCTLELEGKLYYVRFRTREMGVDIERVEIRNASDE